MDDLHDRNREMVDSLVKRGYIRTNAVRQAMLKVKREDFVLAEYLQDAYADMPLPIPGDVTISAPHS
jgi:protein-L-isoaspartate(D-aspartate) O-methyltransferase